MDSSTSSDQNDFLLICVTQNRHKGRQGIIYHQNKKSGKKRISGIRGLIPESVLSL